MFAPSIRFFRSILLAPFTRRYIGHIIIIQPLKETERETFYRRKTQRSLCNKSIASSLVISVNKYIGHSEDNTPNPIMCSFYYINRIRDKDDDYE